MNSKWTPSRSYGPDLSHFHEKALVPNLWNKQDYTSPVRRLGEDLYQACLLLLDLSAPFSGKALVKVRSGKAYLEESIEIYLLLGSTTMPSSCLAQPCGDDHCEKHMWIRMERPYFMWKLFLSKYVEKSLLDDILSGQLGSMGSSIHQGESTKLP